MKSPRPTPRATLALLATLPCIGLAPAVAAQPAAQIEEMIVTAQKREESLQDAPIAISALGTEQLERLGVGGLADLETGSIPSLKVKPGPSSASNLLISIRGVSEADPAQVTRELSTGIYLDGVYLGRAQGLGFDVADMERIEVLRGPQGALYGRNSIGGAINLVTRKPDVEQFSLRQTFGVGNYGARKSVTHANVPVTDKFAAKFSYIHDERDGWVKNSGGEDFNAYEKNGGRLALRLLPTDGVTVDYSYDKSKIEATQIYFQFARVTDVAPGLPITSQPEERSRQERTRFPLPLDPGSTDSEGHALTLSWDLSANHTLKYIGAHREVKENLATNFGGVFLIGLMVEGGGQQSQNSHELQAVGKLFDDQVDYAAGVYYFKEKFKEYNEGFSSVAALDQNGVLFGPALPYTLVPLPESAIYPLGDARRVRGDSESKAVYSQLTWRPAVFDSKLAATLGLRYTEDRKNASRLLFNSAPDNIHSKFSSDNFSPTITFDYAWTEDINTYVKWANGYRAGGFNVRSASFREYGEEKLESLELGWKTMFFDRSLRINGAVFKSEWRDAQLDFLDPVVVTLSETINAEQGKIDIEGLELEVTWIPVQGLTLSADYQYLDWDFPLQRNPLSNQFERFALMYAPKSTAAVNINYELPPLSFGALSFNLNATYTDNFFHAAKNFVASGGATLINARVLLSQIPLGTNGKFEMALWGKNITDEEYVNFSIVSSPSLADAFGTPRTYGVDFTYRYN